MASIVKVMESNRAPRNMPITDTMNGLGLAQINLQHSKVASANIRRLLADMHTKIFLIQEPYFFKEIRGLDNDWGFTYYLKNGYKSRACVYIRKDVDAMMLPQFCSNDMVVVQVNVRRGLRIIKLLCCSLYLPYDAPVISTILENFITFCNENSLPYLIGCDANAHHILWGSSNINERGEQLMDFISSNNLFILNKGNEPTFVNSIREEVIDISLCSESLIPDISDWFVWDELSLSDHRYIIFEIGNIRFKPIFIRNPRATNWEVYKERLEALLLDWDVNSFDIRGLEEAANSLSGAISIAYESACPLKMINYHARRPPLSKKLFKLRKAARKAWNRRRNDPEAYRSALKIYKQAVSEQETNSFQSF